MSKAIATPFPRGVNLILDIDVFYPLQTKLSEWFPATKIPAMSKIDTAETTDKSIESTKNDLFSWVSNF